MGETPGNVVLSLQSNLQMTTALSNIFNCNLMREPKSESSTYATPKFLTLRSCEIINAYYFKLLRFGEISYAIVDTDTMHYKHLLMSRKLLITRLETRVRQVRPLGHKI